MAIFHSINMKLLKILKVIVCGHLKHYMVLPVNQLPSPPTRMQDHSSQVNKHSQVLNAPTATFTEKYKLVFCQVFLHVCSK